MKKVLVAMSGGVDSSVTAALLQQQGYEVVGATMQIWPSQSEDASSCCGITAAHDVKRVCDILGVPHYTLNFKDAFKEKVINNFIEEYKKGRTPNPCIRCNELIKFDLLLKKAKEMGIDLIATGHYARIVETPRYIGASLHKGKDQKKDQSYALYTMDQHALQHTLFPMGDLTKIEARKIAKEFKLPVADKEESQEICFIEDDDYGRFLSEKIPEAVKPGPILDIQGNKVGEHKGIIFYTIGQKKGIGAYTQRKYVIKIDAKNNSIIIGGEEDSFKDSLIASNLNFISGKVPDKPIEVKAKIRYNSPEEPAMLEVKEDKAHVKLLEPQRAVTPGQSVVFYRGNEILGGGIIE